MGVIGRAGDGIGLAGGQRSSPGRCAAGKRGALDEPAAIGR
jgi:hypothetical protein